MPSIGPLELVIVLVIVLLIFGPKRLPGLGRQLGSGMREFKDGITGRHKDDDEAAAPAEPALPPAPAEPAPPAEPARAAAETGRSDADARPPADG
jgi:sec-independent protein translocase protein TatA